jgi:hypothetical protein
MPRATHDHTPSPSRRRLLTGSAASLLATVAAVAAVRAATPTGDDAEIIRLCERLLQPEAEQDALLAGCHTIAEEHRTESQRAALDDEQELIWDQLSRLDDPVTLAGASAMARTAAALWSQEPDGTLHVGWLSDIGTRSATNSPP